MEVVNLGFSLYPDNHSYEDTANYIQMMTKYNMRRVFLSLLQLDVSNEATFNKYKQIIQLLNEHDLMIIADINQDLINALGWQDDLVEKAIDFGLDGLRLDEALDIGQMIELINNKHNFKIELNISQDNLLLEMLLKNGAKKANIIGCHNFYPKRFTGLSMEHFLKTTAIYKQHEIRTAAFISGASADEGPWPVSEGLPTLEAHRDIPSTTQLKEYAALGLIDDVIISNQFVAEAEMQSLVQVDTQELTLEVELLEDLTETEQKVIDFHHTYRNDVSEYVLRSTMPRVVYAEESVPERTQAKQVQRGDILIDNDLYGRYSGELQIALKDFEVSEKTNVVGKIKEYELPLLDYIKPNDQFRLRRWGATYE